MKNNLDIKFLSILVLISVCLLSCKAQQKKETFSNTETYDFAKPKIINLPQVLDEISGIAYYPKDTSVFAVIDEDGLLFKISLNQPDDVMEWRFDKQRDFEDLVYKDSIFYVMVSNGDIDKLTFTGDKIAVDKIDFANASKKVNEFESIYFSPDSSKMIMLCKQCEDDKKSVLSSFYFSDSANQFLNFDKIETEPLFQKMGTKKEKIKPSAAAVNPITKDLYVLCSVNKIIFIEDAQGKLKDVIKLNPKIYKQPEGIAFTPEGDLMISNEVYLEGYATLLLLKNKKKGK
ncbi:MAG: SdiA-regulated domain-containing protein [Ferruginibacter sp.]